MQLIQLINLLAYRADPQPCALHPFWELEIPLELTKRSEDGRKTYVCVIRNACMCEGHEENRARRGWESCFEAFARCLGYKIEDLERIHVNHLRPDFKGELRLCGEVELESGSSVGLDTVKDDIRSALYGANRPRTPEPDDGHPRGKIVITPNSDEACAVEGLGLLSRSENYKKGFFELGKFGTFIGGYTDGEIKEH